MAQSLSEQAENAVSLVCKSTLHTEFIKYLHSKAMKAEKKHMKHKK